MEQQKAMYEAMNRVLSNMSTGGGDGTVTITAPTTMKPSIDALENKIMTFQYDPEEDVTFERWYERYDDIFVHESASMEEGARVRLLLRHIGLREHSQYKDHISPVDIFSRTYDDTVKDLKEMFGKTVSPLEWRVRFLNNKISNTDHKDAKKFAASVNKMYQLGKLKDITEEEMKVTVFLSGLDTPQFARMRTLLLKSVTSKPTITLNEVLEEYGNWMSLEREATAIVSTGEPREVNLVKNWNRDGKDKKSYRKDESNENWRSKVQCYKCKKHGHIARNCSRDSDDSGSEASFERPKRREKTNERYENNSERDYKEKKRDRKVLSVRRSDRPENGQYVKVRVNGKETRFHLDTGADCTIISKKEWEQLGRPPLRSTNTRVTCANKTQLPLLGKFRANVEYRNEKDTGYVYVTSAAITLIGIDFVKSLRIWRELEKSKYDTHMKYKEYKGYDSSSGDGKAPSQLSSQKKKEKRERNRRVGHVRYDEESQEVVPDKMNENGAKTLEILMDTFGLTGRDRGNYYEHSSDPFA